MLSANPPTKNWQLDREQNKLNARSEMSKRSWGEKISFESGQGIVTISSRPAWFTTLYDGGKDQENMFALAEMIRNWKSN